MTTPDPVPAAGGPLGPLGRAGRGETRAGGGRAAGGAPADAALVRRHGPAARCRRARRSRRRLGQDGPGGAGDLHEEDFLRLDDAGQIRAAYPFSAVPTSHLVQIDAGPRVYSMCAVDALGISAMLGAGTRITSADPRTGDPVTVTVQAGGQKAR